MNDNLATLEKIDIINKNFILPDTFIVNISSGGLFMTLISKYFNYKYLSNLYSLSPNFLFSSLLIFFIIIQFIPKFIDEILSKTYLVTYFVLYNSFFLF